MNGFLFIFGSETHFTASQILLTKVLRPLSGNPVTHRAQNEPSFSSHMLVSPVGDLIGPILLNFEFEQSSKLN